MQIRIKYLAGLIILIGSVATHEPATAASFDCTKASAPREQLICGDPDLSALDEQLGHLYQEKRTLLSPHGAELLRDSQRSWLHFVGVVCPPTMPTNSWESPKLCLQNAYRERLQQLGKVAQKAGAFVFNRIDLFAAEPAPPADRNSIPQNPYFQHAAYPQIDNAKSPEEETWNKQNMKNVPTGPDIGDCDGNWDSDYDIGYANLNMISIRTSSYEYCHGAAHGMGWYKANNIIMKPNPRSINDRDLFGTDDQWVTKLQNLFWKALQTQGWEPQDQKESAKKEILDIVIKPDRWLFTKDGLEVSFNSDEGGCYACTPQPVTVVWADLKPLLSPTSPVP